MLLTVAVAASGLSETLRLEFWLQVNPVELTAPGGNLREPGELSERELIQYEKLLEDARWVFSGMIYGFEVLWTPPANARAVEEELTITPVALVPEGDSRMAVISLVEENGFVYVLVEYRPDETQERRISGWREAGPPRASGFGSVSVFLPDSRRGAMEEAIKETVRAWLRAREFNRPREIQGRAAFVSAPELSLYGGEVRAFVSLGMELEPLRHYRID